MPEATPPAAAQAPQVTPPAAPAAATPPVTPPATPTAGNMIPQEAFNARIAETRVSAEKGVLEKLGVDNVEAAVALLAAGKKADDAGKSELERLSASQAELVKANATLAINADAVKVYATSEMASLTETQRASILAGAGEDPAAQLRLIAAVRPTWTAAPPLTAADGTPLAAPPPAALPPPPNSAAPGSMPKGPDVITSPIDHDAKRAALRLEHPMKAALYYIKWSAQGVTFKPVE